MTPPGLTTAAARRRLVETGPNELGRADRFTALGAIARFLASPLILLLLVASVVSALVGQPVDATLIAVMVLLGVGLDFHQTWRSQKAARALRQRVAPTATVARDGAFVELPVREVVPGDVVRLAAGDLVPADATLDEALDLHVNQAALTGESLPVEKHAGDEVFLGTSVVSGTAVATVGATGARTRFGDIAARLAARPPETDFDRGLRRFGHLILETVVFLVLFIALVSIALRRPPFESVLFAVALAVGLTPEFLPMITTVTLSTGAVRMARARVIVKQLAAIQNLGRMDVLCSDKTGTLTVGAMTLERSVDARGAPSDEPLARAALNSRFETGIRSPLDAAILAARPARDDGWRKQGELPFDFERRRLSVLVEKDGLARLVTKGAPEAVLAACALDDEARACCIATYHALESEGLRVLGVASRLVDTAAAVTVADERDLAFHGWLAFSDPPLDGVDGTIARLRADGVTVKVLSGDSERVVRHVARAVGLDARRVLTGDEIDRLDDTELAHVVETTHVFARVSPAGKTRVVRALKARSHVVGFLGDGINDAPSLHAADVGISVASAVDVARAAAAIVLLEKKLAVLHAGIVEGRKAFGNVLKYLLMGTSSNFGNMASMAVASLVLPFLPMLPTQILANNFLYDLAQVTIPTDRVDEEMVARPPRWDVRTVRNAMLAFGPVSSLYDFLTFWVLLHVFRATEAFFHTGWFVESLATQTLVLLVIRTAGRPWRSRPSLPLAAAVAVAVGVGLVLPWSPLAPALGFVRLPPAYYGFVAAATLTYLALVEAVKRRVLRHSSTR